MKHSKLQRDEQRDTIGWDRQAVTYRLTPKRKSGLLAVLGEMNTDASPTEAMDGAIELALASRTEERDNTDAPSGAEIAANLEGLRFGIRILVASVESWAGAREQIASIAADCDELRHAIDSAALLADGVHVSQDGRSIPIKDLLGNMQPNIAWVVFKACWLGKCPAGPGMAVWDVELRELRRSGMGQVQNLRSRATLGPGKTEGPLAVLERESGFVLSCFRAAHGWTLSLRSALEQGKLGEPFADLVI